MDLADVKRHLHLHADAVVEYLKNNSGVNRESLSHRRA
jgi:hypothetical protein